MININPIRQARQELGLSMQTFCVMTNCGMSTLNQNEAGVPKQPTAKIINYLTMRGYDQADLLAKYATYREAAKNDTK